jgi:hypothetical protein
MKGNNKVKCSQMDSQNEMIYLKFFHIGLSEM